MGYGINSEVKKRAVATLSLLNLTPWILAKHLIVVRPRITSARDLLLKELAARVCDPAGLSEVIREKRHYTESRLGTGDREDKVRNP